MIKNALGCEALTEFDEGHTCLVHDLDTRALAALAPAGETTGGADGTAECSLSRGIHAGRGFHHRLVGGGCMRGLLRRGRISIIELTHAIDEAKSQRRLGFP